MASVVAQPFIWTSEGGMVAMPGMVPGNSGVAGLSASGSAASGTFRTSDLTNAQAVRWTAGSGPVQLGTHPTGASSNGLAISADGTTVVGYGDTGTGFQAFRWRAETGMVSLRPVPGTWSEAQAVNADGSVVVGQMDSTTSFRWTEGGGMVPIGPGRAYAVSADGSVIVGEGVGSLNSAYFWTAELGMVNLKGYLFANGATDVVGWNLERATAISADGRVIVGYGRNDLGQVEGFYATIPAPSALLVPAAGLMMATRRRRAAGL
jgi:uncharacterized membrane protein